MAFIQMWPQNQGLRNSITFNGRTYSSVPGVSIPVPDFDAPVLQANGWTTSQINPEYPAWKDFSTAFIYPAWPQAATAGATGSANLILCAPCIIPQIMTLAGLSVNIATVAAGGNFQLAIYSSSSGRPGSLIASTPSGSTASAAFVSVTFPSGVQVGPGGSNGGANLWLCSNRDNATVVFTPVNVVPPSSGLLTSIIGSATTADIISSTGSVIAISTPSAFGTWPASLAGSTWTDVTTKVQPVIYFQPATIP